MRKILQIGLALAFTISLVNVAMADEFDPIAELANNDALLGLDLPSDFENFDPLEIPAEIAEPTENEEAATKSELVIPPAIPTNVGSGGALGEEAVADTTPTITSNFYTPTPSQLYSPTAAGVSVVDTTYRYDLHASARAELTPTGPIATFVLSALVALGLAFMLRKKFVNV